MQLVKNLNTLDRTIRISIGLILLVLSLFSTFSTEWRSGFAILGVGLLTNGLMGY